MKYAAIKIAACIAMAIVAPLFIVAIAFAMIAAVIRGIAWSVRVAVLHRLNR